MARNPCDKSTAVVVRVFGQYGIEWKGEARILDRVYQSTNAPSDKHIARAVTAVLTSVMAKYGVTEVGEAWRLLHDKFVEHWAEQEPWEGRPYEDIVRDKALLKERKYETFLLSEALGRIPGLPSDRGPG